MVPFDSSRRAESNGIIFSPFREKKIVDRKFSKSKFLYLEIFSNFGQIFDPRQYRQKWYQKTRLDELIPKKVFVALHDVYISSY